MYKILLIEDEKAYQRILKDTFEESGFKVSVASEGKQGIIEAARNLPDFILLDLIMPGMNGVTFLNHINLVEGLNKVPIAILTVVPDGVPQKLQGQEVFKNVVGYFIKDVLTPKKIIQEVKNYLGSHSGKQGAQI